MPRALLIQPDSSEKVNWRLRSLRRKTIRTGVLSVIAYPLLTGLSRLIHLVTSRDGSAYPNPDPISDFGVVLTVAGLTLTVALTIIYVGMKGWSNPYTRTSGRLQGTILAGLIITPFSFALFAMIMTVINTVVHKGAYP